MSNRDDSLDMFLQKLDAINSFCESRGDESQHACDGCILSNYCVDIPTRESYEAGGADEIAIEALEAAIAALEEKT